jgi:hypothetical protein
LDDGTIGGTVAQVLADYAKIQAAKNSLGLSVNPSKTELLLVKPVHLNPDEVLDQFNQLTPGIKLIKEEDLTLLGAPINIEGISKVLKPKLESLELMCSRLVDLDRHEATFLLKNAFNIPKLNYFLRTAPCFLENETLEMFDNTLQTSIQKILNVKMDDKAWNQASQPLCYGDLGIRKALEIALPAFLASAHGSTDMVRQLNPSRLRDDPITHLGNAIQKWSDLMAGNQGGVIPTKTSAQNLWDKPLCDIRHEVLLQSTTSEIELARLKAVSAKHASDWLKAYPVTSLGLKLNNSSFRIACALRIGAPICLPHPCICGKTTVDQFGRHGLSCNKAAISRNARHNHANSLIQKALTSAEFAAIWEPKGLFATDKKRPDGMTTFPYKGGKSLAWDFTVVDTVCATYCHKSAEEPCKTAEQAELRKIHKYRHLTDFHFIPIGAETLGPFGPHAVHFLKDLGNKISKINGERRSKSFLFQSIGIAIQRGNASCVMGTTGSMGKLEELNYL